MKKHLETLAAAIEGDLFFDNTMRILYATDASVYRELPLGVAMPKHKSDVKKIIEFANKHNISMIPRSAGTSLAGQCVGTGLVVDVSKYMTSIVELNTEEHWIKVQPGVVRDELNAFIEPHGLQFGPNTSTANRCMIGGMVGNNSCGSTSIVYGNTRDHLLEVEVILSDGSEVIFKALNKDEFYQKLTLKNLEGEIYRHLHEELSKPNQQEEIRKEFPKSNIKRRNTGYAVDVLLESEIFTAGKPQFNFCNLIAGSEGTLAFLIEIKINLLPLPPKHKLLVCSHFTTVQESLEAVLIAMKHQPEKVELMDKIIMDCTKESSLYKQNRFFIEGEPEAVLVVEVAAETSKEVHQQADNLIAAYQKAGFGYAHPKVTAPKQIKQVWDLRKAGLGLLANIKGDAKAVAVIEDTAVDVIDLPAYIADFTKIMDDFGQRSVYYAHAGAGELHLRPILDLKQKKDRQLFHDIGEASAHLVKKYNGSLSGEHGDGRVRAEFIPIMIGENNYNLLKRLKFVWDAKNLFNPGKIVDAPPMNTAMRYDENQETKTFDTLFNFDETDGILRAAEKCNGSGDCRKLPLSGGTMCPSYQATRDEKSTTRARANILREMLTRHNDQPNPFNHKEIYDVLDLCLSCKGCTSECPSNVDISTLKAEFLHQYYKSNGIPFRAKVFSYIGKLNGLGAIIPSVTNFFLTNKVTSGAMKKLLKVAPERQLPILYKTTLRKWFKRFGSNPVGDIKGTVYLFCDEFTNYNDTEIGIKAIQLLNKLGYDVKIINHEESGRTFISKGLLPQAQKMAQANVEIFKNIISNEIPLIGIEPSAILGFKDEYPKLVKKDQIETSKQLGENCLLLEEFLHREVESGNISTTQFTEDKKHVLLHGHCHQKALSSVDYSAWVLGLPTNFTVEVIPSGCCGMAGSFGYELEHYEVSMKVGELVLFPAVRAAISDTIIAAPGTSCRHQIADGTSKKALHPIEILWNALK